MHIAACVAIKFYMCKSCANRFQSKIPVIDFIQQMHNHKFYPRTGNDLLIFLCNQIDNKFHTQKHFSALQLFEGNAMCLELDLSIFLR